MFKQIHHIAFAVYNLDMLIDLMKNVYDMKPESRIEIGGRQMEAVLFKTGESYLEYLAPLSDESPLYEYLQKNGEGFHHIAYLVEDIEDSKKILPPDAIIRERKSDVGNWLIADLNSKYALGLTSQIIQK